MEPLQSHLEYERGLIKDPALGTLIMELARENSGLCVITTRENVADLEPFGEAIVQTDLEQISDEAGRALLRVRGIRGTDEELEAATREFGNHALALNLLSVYLHDISGHDISNASEIPDLDIPVEEGRHPRRVMTAFHRRFGTGPEVELLRILGLFDRPARVTEIEAVQAAPIISDLTEHLQYQRKTGKWGILKKLSRRASRPGISDGDWLGLLDNLRRTGLVAPKSEHNPETLDAHPLVREHFGQQLRELYPEGWREGNNRLYEHLKKSAPDLPDTIEEMAPLFAAVAHGCQAGRHQEALDKVYYGRIKRAGEAFSTKKLGAFGAGLAALSGFFDPPWNRPVAGLSKAAKGFVLSEAGFELRALGRLAEAIQPMQAGLEAAIAPEDWKNAAIRAGNLSEVYLTLGDTAQAVQFAEKSVDFAERSGDEFQRMGKRATLADALHQAGRLAEAEVLFQKAEEMQKKEQPNRPFLYSLRGFQYCDLLLDQGKHQEVQNRAGQTLEWVKQAGLSLLTIALNHLSLGRAHLLQTQQEETDDFSKAAEHLDEAVDGLRKSGQQDELPLGLLARAALNRLRKDFDRAQRDVDEAMTIAARGGMGLHQADANLEYARLHLDMDEMEKARERLDTAKEMIDRMGYHRRDKDVKELEERLRGNG